MSRTIENIRHLIIGDVEIAVTEVATLHAHATQAAVLLQLEWAPVRVEVSSSEGVKAYDLTAE